MTTPDDTAATDPWSEMLRFERALAALLTRPDTFDQWPLRLRALAQRIGDRARERPDGWLFAVFLRASQPSDRYSVSHALACAMVCDLACAELGFDEAARRRLTGAALTMNMAMTELQNELAQRHQTLSAAQRDAVRDHPQHSARLLRELGLDDPEWLQIVTRHHLAHPGLNDDPVAEAAALLRRIDILFAKLSPRASRKPLPAIAGVRAACLDRQGRPDRIGMALIRCLGFHPPGTCLRLASGDWGVAVRRGEQPGQPVVACVMDAQRQMLPVPVLRWTSQPGFEVASAVPASELRWSVPVERLMACIDEAAEV